MKTKPRFIRSVRSDYDDGLDFLSMMGGHHGLVVFEDEPHPPQFSGLLTARGEPIVRVFMQKPGIGFLCQELEEFDPDLYFYANGQTGEPLEEEELEED